MVYNDYLKTVKGFESTDFSIKTYEEYRSFNIYKSRIYREGAGEITKYKKIFRKTPFYFISCLIFLILAFFQYYFIFSSFTSIFINPQVYTLAICSIIFYFYYNSLYNAVEGSYIPEDMRQFLKAFNENDSDIRIEWMKQKEAYKLENK